MRTKLSRRDCTRPRQLSAWRGWRRIGFIEDGPDPGSRWALSDVPQTPPVLFATQREALQYLVERSLQLLWSSKVSTVPFVCAVCGEDATRTERGSYSHTCKAWPE